MGHFDENLDFQIFDSPMMTYMWTIQSIFSGMLTSRRVGGQAGAGRGVAGEEREGRLSGDILLTAGEG